MITFDTLNTCPAEEAYTHLESCCVSSVWVNKIIESRPFSSIDELIEKAASVWYHECSVDDFKEAFTGHPVIGDVNSLKEKFSRTKDWAGNEQSKMSEADEATIEALAEANKAYKDKFGYIFIVSASGKSAEEMLAILNSRMRHDPSDEVLIARNEQHKISCIRLAKLIDGLEATQLLSSQITTHALDTSLGKPVYKMSIILKERKEKIWKPISVGVTNTDGRISDVLAPGYYLKPGSYKMIFMTKEYFDNSGQEGFYPQISIQFKVTDKSHYHIPLLLSPYGFTTYRGS